jgi:hypothetical protein
MKLRVQPQSFSGHEIYKAKPQKLLFEGYLKDEKISNLEYAGLK